MKTKIFYQVLRGKKIIKRNQWTFNINLTEEVYRSYGYSIRITGQETA